MKISTLLLNWYDKHGRDLPWRKTTNPYHILVSEIMLQQTQVSRGLIFYEKWLREFPDWETLSKASNGQVIKAWSGLGYNRRALQLRDIAKAVVEQGQPNSVEGWESLKGIGSYTARALMVFAFKQKELPIDTNIRRVLGRVFLGILFPQLEDDKKIAETFSVRSKRYDDVIQSLFDLANTHCLKKPECISCPLKSNCLAANTFLKGDVEVPKAMIKKAKETKHTGKSYPDRIYRGRILRMVKKEKDVLIKTIGPTIDKGYSSTKDKVWLESMINRLEKEGFIIRSGNTISLTD